MQCVRSARSAIASFCGAGIVVGLTACEASSPPPSPASSASASASAIRPAHSVTAVVLVNGCAHLGAGDAQLAEAAINQLVDGCGGLAEEHVQFTATLLPGGAIQFEPRPGDSTTVPVCVLSHPLTHKVRLQKACSLDVRLEAGSVAVPSSRSAP